MAWLDGTYLQNAIGSDQGYALGLLTTATGTTVTARFTQYEFLARARVSSVLQFAGYSPPGATLLVATDAQQVTAAFYQQLAAAILLNDVYALVPGISISQQAAQSISVGLSMLESVYDKKLPVPGGTATPLDGYGGSQFNTNGTQAPVTNPVWRTLRGSTF